VAPRAPLLLLLSLAAACAEKLEGRTADEWALELADAQRRAQAFETLRSRGAEAVPILAAIVQTGPTSARIQAADLLARVGPGAEAAVPALAEALKAPDRGVRGMAAIALGRIGPGAADALIPLDRALSDKDIRVRVAASLAVYGITGDTAAPTRVLYRALLSGSPDVRAMAAEAFAELGTPVVDFLVRSLGHADETTRADAARTLAAMGPGAAEARGALQDALDDPSETVRAAAAEALTRLDSR
jgi:hypothetical protein